MGGRARVVEEVVLHPEQVFQVNNKSRTQKGCSQIQQIYE